MTAEDIIKAVAENIYFSYGSEIPIYSDSIKQGFICPCFFIEEKETEISKWLGDRYYKRWNVTVSYYFGEEDKTEPVNFFENLEFITADGQVLRGTGASIRSDNERVRLNIAYGAFFIREKTEAPYMAALIEKGKGM